MRWICFLLLSLSLSGGLSAQDKQAVKETKKEASQLKKEEKKVKIEKLFKKTDSLLEGKKFILEAQFLKNNSGNRFPVTSNLNFISVDSLTAVLQVGSPQRVGFNGVGGVTVQGRLFNWKLEKDIKRKTFYLTMTVQGNIDIYDVSMSIDYEGYANATLNGINSGRLTFEGNLVSKDETLIFKGMTR
jgi:hypothetical protein